MMKLFILILCLVLSPLTISAQGDKITNKKVKEVLHKFERYSVDLIEVKTLKKWRALELSRAMKSHMNYNVVRVKYKTMSGIKTVIIDMHLVPIHYASEKVIDKKERKNNYATLSYADHY